jgi:hypothetical protein
MSLKTGGFKELISAQDHEQLLRSKFVGIPEDWYAAVAEQAAKEVASPAGGQG